MDTVKLNYKGGMSFIGRIDPMADTPMLEFSGLQEDIPPVRALGYTGTQDDRDSLLDYLIRAGYATSGEWVT